MRDLFIALTLIPLGCLAESVVIMPAEVLLNQPEGWELKSKDSYPEAPSNVCFPRLEKGGTRIDCVIWKDAPSLEIALNQYLARLPAILGKEATYEVVEQESFSAASGIKGLKSMIRIKRTPDCGSIDLVRYIFRNKHHQIVCLGGVGDLNEIHRLTIASLSTK